MIRKLSLTIISILILHFGAIGDYYPRDWDVDIRHYFFSLHLTDDSDLIRGEAILDIYFKDEVEHIFLDLTNKNNSGKGMTVTSVRVEGRKSTYEHEQDRLQIKPETVFKTGEIVRVIIEYEGVPIDGLIIAKNKYGERTFFGDNWPDRARNWLPSVDHPSDKAGVDFIVRAPEHYQVIANGIQIEESNIEDGFKLTHWHEEVDISTKVMVIGVARFAVQLSGMVDHIPVQAWVYPQNREEGFYDYSPAVKVLDYFDSHIGEYSYKKLANVQSKTRYGGMENASNIFYFENSVSGNQEIEALIAHEIAHQWFGNSASEKDWHHVWLSEGFATYFTHLYMEHTYGVDMLRKRMANDRKVVINFSKQSKVPVVNPSIRNYNNLLNANSYQKGGWVLHMLRNEIGDEAFWTGIRNYYRKYRNTNALTKDLRLEMETASGRDLETFFDQWIFKSGQPDLLVSWNYNKGAQNLDVTIEQLQKETNFDFTLVIQTIDDSGSSENFLAEVTESKQTFTFDCNKMPSSIALDPGVKLLFTAKIETN